MAGDHPLLEGSETWVEPTSSGSKFPYYGFFRDVSTGIAPESFQVTYRDTSDSHRDLRLWMTGEAGSTVYLGITPNPERTNPAPPHFYKYWRPSTIVRHRISSGTLHSLYAGVVEPLADGVSAIQSVTRLPLVTPDLEAVALRVAFADGRVDTYLINLRNPKIAGAGGGGSTTIATADGEFALTGRFGAYLQRPGDPRVWTVGADSFRFGGRTVATAPSSYSGRIVGMTRKADGAVNDAFIVDAPLPLGAALQGRHLSLTFGDYRVVGTTTIQKGISEMFESDHVEEIDGQTHVVLTRDHQLKMSDTTTTEQMAPQRTFTGTNTCEIVLGAVPDIVPPVLWLPAAITAEATGPGGAEVTFAVSAMDDRDGEVLVKISPPPGSLFPLGTTTVTASATDAAGNTATGTFTVTVRDT